MRDTTFTLQALHYLNLDWEADEFIQFVADVEPNEDGSLQIMYGIDGRRDLAESTLDHLSGYGGARPVRIGNGAFDQRQNDVTRRPRLTPPPHPGGASVSRDVSGRPSTRRPSARQTCGRVPTRGSGRHGERRSTTCRRSSCAGSHSIARRSSRRSEATRRCGTSGPRRRRRSRPTSSSTASPSAASSASMTQRNRRRLVLLAAIFGFLPHDDERRASVLAIADELTEHGFVCATERRTRTTAYPEGGARSSSARSGSLCARDHRRGAART